MSKILITEKEYSDLYDYYYWKDLAPKIFPFKKRSKKFFISKNKAPKMVLLKRKTNEILLKKRFRRDVLNSITKPYLSFND